MNLNPQLPEINLLAASSVYLVGIKGVGMAALAVLLREAGLQVSGADVTEEFVTDEQLREHNIPVDDFATAVLPDRVEIVIYSGAHQGSKQNLVQEARRRGIPCVNLAQAVGLISQQKETIAVCGVGGKSTTSALLSCILEKAGWLPSFAVGVGNIPNLGTAARWQPEGKYFVVEADEYVSDPQLPDEEKTPRFLTLSPAHIICTSLVYDHPDVYHDFSNTQAAFQAFFAKLPANGVLVVNGDNQELVELARSGAKKVISVGSAETNDVRLSDFQVVDGVGRCWLEWKGKRLELRVNVPGFHNVTNAAYAAVLAVELGVPGEVIEQAVSEFRSTTRRFELIGMTGTGMRCFDDYAHHPRELQAIAEALQDWFPKQKIAMAFQPHTFSRTKALFSEFVHALSAMPGEVVLLPIFASARESADPSISSKLLVQALQQQGKAARYLQNRAELLEYMQQFAQTGNVFITLGAGDIYKVYEQFAF